MLLKRIVFLFLLLSSSPLWAQVNLQTGSAVFSLPLFSWQDHKSRLTNAIALNYSSGSGLKVNEVASNVGQGWNLMAGGVITRMQVGEPDDQQAYEASEQSRYPNGYLYAVSSSPNGCPVALKNYPVYEDMNHLYVQRNNLTEDKQLDYFSFQFNGKSGLFVLDRNSYSAVTNTYSGVTLGDSKMKITFTTGDLRTSDNARTTILSFTVTDVDGLIYRFARRGMAKLLHTEYCDRNMVQSLRQPEFKSGEVYHQAGFDTYQANENPWIVNNWFLTEIEDGLTHRKVTLNYTDLYSNATVGDDVNFNEGDYDYCVVMHRNSITKYPRLDNIMYPDGHQVNFLYQGTQRYDFSGQYALDRVDITYQSRYYATYKLNTSYFIKNRYGTPFTEYQKKMARLCLRSVQKYGVDQKEDTPPYLFDYYMGGTSTDDIIPPPYGVAKDVWGYYNGANTKPYDVSDPLISPEAAYSDLNYGQLKGTLFLRHSSSFHVYDYNNAKDGYAKNGLLKQIIYPTGGTLSFDYAQNEGDNGNGQQLVGGVHVSKTSSADGGYSNDCDHPLTTNYKYTLAGSNTSSLWGLEAPKTNLVFTNDYDAFTKYVHYSFPLSFECRWRYKYPGILSMSQSIDLPNFIQVMNALAPVLGIINIISTIKDVVSAFADNNPVGLVIDIILSVLSFIFSCAANPAKTSITGIYYTFDLNGGNPLPVQFKRVEVTESPGGNGKVVHDFTSKDDYPLWVGENANTIFSSKQRFASWAYGLPLKTTVYNDAGNIVKQTRNVYNFNVFYQAGKCGNDIHYNRSNLLKQQIDLFNVKCMVNRSVAEKVWDWRQGIDDYNYILQSNSNIQVDTFRLYTGRTEVDSVIERTYKPSGTAFLETQTGYVYNDDNYQVSSIRTMGTDGRFREKNIYYTVSFTSVRAYCYNVDPAKTTDPAIVQMVAKNMINVPVEINEAIVPPLSYLSDQYVSEQATLFSILPNGDIKPTKILEGRFAQPTMKTSPWPIETNGSPLFVPGPLLKPESPDYSFFKVAKTLSYDATGNLVSIQDEGGRIASSVYCYNDKFVKATAVNAQPNELFFDGFDESSGWSGSVGAPYGGIAISAYDNTRSHSGYFSGRIDKPTSGESYCHSDKLLAVSLSGTTKFKLSGWVYSNGPSVDIYLFMYRPNETSYFSYVDYMTTSTTGKWVYLEKEFSVPSDVTSLGIRLDNNGGGSVWFDDIRLYPSTAQMISYAYDPLIGKLTESDANSRNTNYEYDNLGRLKFIKDENGNALKMYEYNTVTKQNGCPGTYYNKMIVDTFQKNNCGSGYIGSKVGYTVPASMFSSTISQQDADIKAENYLQTQGQNNANTTGQCIQVFTNDAQTQYFTSQCGIGYTGGSVAYSVPSGKYSSIWSKQDANNLALAEIKANGQAYANSDAAKICNVDPNPSWESDENPPSECRWVGNEIHMFVLVTDMNPNSSSYYQQQWFDTGVTTTSCTPVGPTTVDIRWQNDTSCDYYFILTNNSTGEEFYVYADAGSWDYISISSGSYDVRVSSGYGYYCGWSYFDIGCGSYSATGTPIFNVNIDQTCNQLYIHY